MSEAIQTSIYKLRQSIAVIDDATKRLHSVAIDFSYLEKEFVLKGYSKQEVKQSKDAKHIYELYYKSWPMNIRWKEFIGEIAEDDADILKNEVAINEGFVLLIRNKKSDANIYAVTGGFGHIELQRFIDYQFGLDILSRLIKYEDKVLRTAKERNFIGGVLGSVKYFRDDYNLNENEGFGNFYQELKAKLDKVILKEIFKFTDSEIKKGGLCEAKSSFTIRKPLTIGRVSEIVDILHSLTKKKSIVDLNMIKKLDKSDKALIEKLEHELYNELFKIYKGSTSDLNFEICHKYFDKYFDADEYNVLIPSTKGWVSKTIVPCENFKHILEEYNSEGLLRKNRNDFEKLIENTKISSSYEGNSLTTGMLVDHICAEIPFNGRNYFLFNQEWFWLKKDFVTILNNQCQELMNSKLMKNNLNNWKVLSEDENAFNAGHISSENTLVFDKIAPENIEACDILKWSDDEIFFIHVKKGFNNEMRNLGRQVHIAARRIQEDLKTGKKYLSKLYDTLKNMDAKDAYFIAAKNQLSSLKKSDFLKLFENRKPVFIVAICDESDTGKRDFSDMKKYRSNIAKFCLQQLRQEMQILDMKFQIVQIEK